jgi:hypothetical protein
MSGYRSQANHSLYLARIVSSAWRQAIDSEQIPVVTLAQAFDPAVRGHLVAAYGWFLLEITRPDPAPELPPRSCSELGVPAQGRVHPGEIREFQRLEADGWLRDLLRPQAGAAGRVGQSGNLAVAAAGPGPREFEAWGDTLQGFFERMSDSLDEY